MFAVCGSPLANASDPESFMHQLERAAGAGLIRERDARVECVAGASELRQERIGDQRLGRDEGRVGGGEVRVVAHRPRRP